MAFGQIRSEQRTSFIQDALLIARIRDTGAGTVSQKYGIPINPLFIVLEEDSAVMKEISCIPFLGILPSFIQEVSLARQIRNTTNVSRLIALINVKNEYKTANIARNLLTAALIITGIAFGILSHGIIFGTVTTLLLASIARLEYEKINRNKAMISELQNAGIRPGGMIVL